MSLHNYGKLYQGIVVKRPSRYVKSPYVADVYIDDTGHDDGPQNTILCQFDRLYS